MSVANAACNGKIWASIPIDVGGSVRAIVYFGRNVEANLEM